MRENELVLWVQSYALTMQVSPYPLVSQARPFTHPITMWRERVWSNLLFSFVPSFP